MIFSSLTVAAFFSPLIAVAADFFSAFALLRLIGFSFDELDPIDETLSTAVLLSFLFIDFDFFSLFSDSSFALALTLLVVFLTVNFLLATDFTDELLMGRALVAVFGLVVFFALDLSDFVSGPPANLVWGFFARILVSTVSKLKVSRGEKKKTINKDLLVLVAL